jgi:hypothetical protein
MGDLKLDWLVPLLALLQSPPHKPRAQARRTRRKANPNNLLLLSGMAQCLLPSRRPRAYGSSKQESLVAIQ